MSEPAGLSESLLLGGGGDAGGPACARIADVLNRLLQQSIRRARMPSEGTNALSMPIVIVGQKSGINLTVRLEDYLIVKTAAASFFLSEIVTFAVGIYAIPYAS
jgi:hypothetical protein